MNLSRSTRGSGRAQAAHDRHIAGWASDAPIGYGGGGKVRIQNGAGVVFVVVGAAAAAGDVVVVVVDASS